MEPLKPEERKSINEYFLKELEPKKELVDHPAHYNTGKFEHVEVVENWHMSPHMKDATKYLMRTTKGSLILDTQKCRWYICRMIERPWTAQAVYPKPGRADQFGGDKFFSADEVANDWFPERGDRYYAFQNLCLAMLAPSNERIVEHLIIARGHVDIELKKLLKDDQTGNDKA